MSTDPGNSTGGRRKGTTRNTPRGFFRCGTGKNALAKPIAS